MPCLRGMAPTMMQTSMLVKATTGSAVVDTSAARRRRGWGGAMCKVDSLTLEEGEGTVLQLHDNALHDLHHWRDVQEEEFNGLVHAEHVTARQGVEEGVGDLAGRPSDADPKRLKEGGGARTSTTTRLQ